MSMSQGEGRSFAASGIDRVNKAGRWYVLEKDEDFCYRLYRPRRH